MNIILYKTTTCPKCKVAKMKLEQKGIPFVEEMNVDVMTSRGITTIPTLSVDGKLYKDIRAIVDFINGWEAVK